MPKMIDIKDFEGGLADLAHRVLEAWRPVPVNRWKEADIVFNFTDRYEALGIPTPDPATVCHGQCEGTGWVPVKEDESDKTFRDLWLAAEAIKKTDDGWHFVECPQCAGTGLRTTNAKESHVSILTEASLYERISGAIHGIQGHYFRVSNGRFQDLGTEKPEGLRPVTGEPRTAVVYADRSASTHKTREEAKKAAQASSKGQHVKGREVGPNVYKVGQGVFEALAISASGDHTHPHEADGEHEHFGLPAGGAHSHEAKGSGSHAHRAGDPIEGGHLNAGPGRHEHWIAKGLIDYVTWAADQHHPVHKWLPGHVKTWIKHIGIDKEFREARGGDWFDHMLWENHPSILPDPDAHTRIFIDKDTRIIEKEYEFEDGTRRPATREDFDAELSWFGDNTPPEFVEKLREAKVPVDGLTDHTSNSRSNPLDLPSIESLVESMCRIVTEGLHLLPRMGQAIANGYKTGTVVAQESKGLEDWRVLAAGDLAFGVIRHGSPKRITNQNAFRKLEREHLLSESDRASLFPQQPSNKASLWFYPIRDFVRFPTPRMVTSAKGSPVLTESVEYVKPKAGKTTLKKTSPKNNKSSS